MNFDTVIMLIFTGFMATMIISAIVKHKAIKDGTFDPELDW